MKKHNVLLHTKVDDRNLITIAWEAHLLLACDIQHNMSHAPCLDPFDTIVLIKILIRCDHALHRTFVPQNLR